MPRWLVLLVAAGVALGSLLGVVSWFRPHPYPVLLPLFFDSSGGNGGSVIAQVHGDVTSLRAGRWFSRTIGSGGSTITAGHLGSALDALAGLRSNETLVAVLCSPARIGIRSTGSGESDEIFVMPGGRAEGLSGWVPLRDVLGMLSRSPAKRVLLLLDVMRPLVDPVRGQLVDDVAAHVASGLADSSGSASRHIAVLCAASTGQVSWASEVWGRSVFLAYAEEGLSGWADLEPVTGNRDGRVSLNELVDYVVPRVNRWAVRCRGVRQTPVLLGSRDDFPIAPRRNLAARDASGSSRRPGVSDLAGRGVGPPRSMARRAGCPCRAVGSAGAGGGLAGRRSRVARRCRCRSGPHRAEHRGRFLDAGLRDGSLDSAPGTAIARAGLRPW